jgi:hypothetical protein
MRFGRRTIDMCTKVTRLILASVIAVIGMVVFGVSNPPKPMPKLPKAKLPLLSVEETIMLATLHYVDSVPEDAIERTNRANPAARPALYAILEDNSKQKEWLYVMAFFSFVGQDDDVDKMEGFILSRTGQLNNFEFTAVTRAIYSLGGMGNRGCTKAQDKLNEMVRPAYWSAAKFTKYVPPAGSYPTFENEMALRALQGLAYSLTPEFDEKAAELLAGIKDPDQHKMMEAEVKRRIEFRDEFERGAFKWGISKQSAGPRGSKTATQPAAPMR